MTRVGVNRLNPHHEEKEPRSHAGRSHTGSPTRAHDGESSTMIWRGLADTGCARPFLPESKLIFSRILMFLRGFLDFLMETIRFSRDCINTIVIQKLEIIFFSL